MSGTATQTSLTVLLGTNGTGKTTFAAKIVDTVLQRKGRALIVTPHDREWNKYKLIDTPKFSTFTGAARHIFDEKTTLQALENYHTGLLIFDDCRAYLNSNTNDNIHRLLISRRQRKLNTIAVGHGFTEVPPKFFTFCTEIVLFRTLDNISSRKNVLQNYEAMVQHQLEVNAKATRIGFFYENGKETPNRFYHKIIKML